MGMHADEWEKYYREEAIKDNPALASEPSNYKLPDIKVQFGEEYVPVPQIGLMTAILTNYGSTSLESGIFYAMVSEAMDRLRMKQYKEEDKPRLKEEIGKIIFEKGPEYVLDEAYQFGGYSWEADLFL